MMSASREWMARVAAQNEIETAKALREGRAVPLSAGSVNGQDARCPREGGAK